MLLLVAHMPPKLIFQVTKEAVSRKLAHCRGGGVGSEGKVYNPQCAIAGSMHDVGYF